MLTFLRFAHTPWGNTPIKLSHVQKRNISGGEYEQRVFFFFWGGGGEGEKVYLGKK